MHSLIRISIMALSAGMGTLFAEMYIRAASREIVENYSGSPSVLETPLGALWRRTKQMPLREKVGQMLIVGVPDAELSRETSAWLRSERFGGVILLGKNIREEQQTRKLIADIKGAFSGATAPFIAADQEGGAVSRFTFSATREHTPQSEITSPEQARAVAEHRGDELRTLGVNVNFSPVLDVSSSPSDFIHARTFRGDAATVSVLGAAMIEGYRRGGIFSAAKHFPGHGGTPTDSHRDLPLIPRSPDLQAEHTRPFRQAIERGVPIIMMGHLKIPELDPHVPASLSDAAVRLLRNEFGFRGIIMTDDLAMGAITGSLPLERAAAQAIRAGSDMILAVRAKSDYENIENAIIVAVERGEISESQINESVMRILAVKGGLAP